MKADKKRKGSIVNLILPTLVLGAITGILTSVTVNFYKFIAKYIIHFSEAGYELMRNSLWWAVAVAAALAVVAFVMAYIYRRHPDLKGGGIPASIGALRGIFKLKWSENVVGVFILSMLSFFVGVPLGNEGPSVQMGCAIGGGVSKIWEGKHKAWERYSMTGGACAGFSVATGAPISGVVFAIEEAHRRISPMILTSAAAAVFFAGVTTEIIAPILGVSKSLFPQLSLPVLTFEKIWIPLAVGVVSGVFAVAFLKLYAFLDKLFNKKMADIPHQYKIFGVYLMTLICGLISVNFISTGHELVLHMLESRFPVIMLLLIIVIRTILTLSANTNGITGGTFLPLLAIGCAVGGVVAKLAVKAPGVGEEYYALILVLGLIGCISAMMKMPLTAVVFAVEALFCFDNIVYVILVVMISYLITEIFAVKSINDLVVEKREEKIMEAGTVKVVDKHVTVGESTFASGREISDILWPKGLIILSVHKEAAHGGSVLMAGDVLHIRCATVDEDSMDEELEAIVGKQ